MTHIVTAVFDVSADELAAAEKRDPATIAAIGELAMQYMIGHTRYTREQTTMDIDVYRSEADYWEFFAKAETLIRAYAAGAGGTVVDTLWKQQEQ